MDTTALTKDTTLCISLAGRPSNVGTRFHNHLYGQLGLDFVYKAFTTTDLPSAVAGIQGPGDPRLRGVDALQAGRDRTRGLDGRLGPCHRRRSTRS